MNNSFVTPKMAPVVKNKKKKNRLTEEEKSQKKIKLSNEKAMLVLLNRKHVLLERMTYYTQKMIDCKKEIKKIDTCIYEQ